MSQAQVSELMAHVETDTLGVLVHCIDDIRHQHDILQTKEPGGKGIQGAVAGYHVSPWPFRHVQTVTTSTEVCVQVRELCLGQLNAVALDVRDQGRLGKEIQQEAHGQHKQRATEGAYEQYHP